MSCAIDFELRRSWLVGGYWCELLLRMELTPALASEALNLVAHVLAAELLEALPGDHRRNFELLNLKGRDPHEQPLLDGAPALIGEELFSVGGLIATRAPEAGLAGDLGGDDKNKFNWEPFHYGCFTSFDRFEGSRTIAHVGHQSYSENIPDWFPWWLLGAAAPIEPRYFRLGLDFFTSRFVITRLSFTPIVTESFMIDLVGTKIAIKLRTEQPYWKPCNPFLSNRLLKALAAKLTSVIGSDLATIFKDRLTERGLGA